MSLVECKSSVRAGLALAAFLGPWLLSAQPALPVAAPSPLDHLLSLASDPDGSVDLNEVRRVLDALDPGKRTDALRKLITAPNNIIACQSAGYAIRADEIDLAGVIAVRMPAMNRRDQVSLMSLLSGIGARFEEIPREFVRRAALQKRPHEDLDSPMEPIGLAAMLLSSRGGPSDKGALLALAQSAPNSWGVWIAVAQARALDPAAAQAAYQIYRDPKRPPALRVAAATALQSADAEARRFAISETRSFVDRYPGLAVEQLDFTEETQATVDFFNLTSRLEMFVPLLVLDDEDAEPLVLRYLTSTNLVIQSMCATVAVIRWPKQFLAVDRSRFADGLYEPMLALLQSRHPREGQNTAPDASSERMRDAIQKVEVLGVRVGVFTSLYAYLIPPPKR